MRPTKKSAVPGAATCTTARSRTMDPVGYPTMDTSGSRTMDTGVPSCAVKAVASTRARFVGSTTAPSDDMQQHRTWFLDVLHTKKNKKRGFSVDIMYRTTERGPGFPFIQSSRITSPKWRYINVRPRRVQWWRSHRPHSAY